MTHVVVTGSASGIGRAVVDDLLSRGCSVTGIDLAEGPSLSQVVNTIADVTDEESMRAAFATGVRQWGVADGLVACHGIRGQFVPTMEMDLAAARKLIDVHLIGTLVAARCFAEQLPDYASGSIVGVSSTTAYGGWVNQADYGPAKAAVQQLLRNLAIEWAPRIRVNAVAPGHTRTPMVQSMLDNGYDIDPVLQRNPLGRLAEPAEIATVINQLLLEDTFVTGVCLPVDGGWTAVGK
ncbi:SDR family NAD(P)-dependent oxidoreductase [Enemella sp. A6]|uniref:SDR family NAD(P)-dependent oxidoreductase n=1 Tax=Enemella sp. A6 TaxID=3440152 RepID=UPI003EB93C12